MFRAKLPKNSLNTKSLIFIVVYLTAMQKSMTYKGGIFVAIYIY